MSFYMKIINVFEVVQTGISVVTIIFVLDLQSL